MERGKGAGEPMSFIQFENVTRRYNQEVTALDRVSLEIRSGEWVAVMGPSGSGKTTLLNLLGGLDMPDTGRVRVDGLDLTALSRPDLIRYRRERVGLVFQQFHLIPYLSAVENVMLAQYLHSLADEEEAARALEEVGLGHRLRHLPSALSGGEKQRVCIARALINRPRLILADEPTGSLDEENERAVMDLFQTMHDRGQTIVMVTHDLSVGRRADRQVQLEHGRVAGEFLTQAQDEEAIDEVLEYLWLRSEGDLAAHDTCAVGARLATPQLFGRMRARGILAPGAEVAFSESGRRRAESLIRRHRLAETLFSETFQMHAAVVEEEACYFEHILSPVMTDSICSFLGHPPACPHGKAIPRGACCAVPPSQS
ncbi:MAG TPA: ATP-binding cassette domain-containing protein [Candidatus Polarisedimenticolia bacterium]|nr:ATP-binding cassette domain-containing protein [Candidatus Polarisedimenticolia bacterium]